MKAPILVIEDNDQNAYMIAFLLEQAGHRVVHAPDGRRGIAMAEAERPAIVLLDIQLPEMDGYEVARRLRALPSLEGVPVVAVTSYAMAGDSERALAAGCTGYVEKPIDPDTFVATVERHLGLKGAEE